MSYDFPVGSFRAQCLRVVDGDTCDLFVDVGFHQYQSSRFRLYGIDTPELNSKDPTLKARAVEAKRQLEEWLQPTTITLMDSWNLKIVAYKDPDNFGRWLATIYRMDDLGEHCVNDELVSLGMAVRKTY